MARGYFYDGLSLGLGLGGLYFFYRATGFLLDKDYIAAALILVAGFLALRVSVEMARLALLARRRAREAASKERA
jgi:hypothetical protein